MQLKDETYEKILKLSKEGEVFFEKRAFVKAIELYEEALQMVPLPHADWEAASWLNVAIGDAYYFQQNYQKALDYMYDAFSGVDGVSNPFINLRLGQCLFELGNLEKAENYLLRAHMLEGIGIFKGENKKYLKFLKSKYDL